MDLVIKKFNELSADELYKILKLRSEVFVVEQNCAFLDIDGLDYNAMHLIIKQNDEIVSYLRIIPKENDDDFVSMGRVATNEKHRKKGLSRISMGKAIDFIKNIWKEDKIKIGAQKYLTDFYSSLGFKEINEPYFENDIEHIEMILSK